MLSTHAFPFIHEVIPSMSFLFNNNNLLVKLIVSFCAGCFRA